MIFKKSKVLIDNILDPVSGKSLRGHQFETQLLANRVVEFFRYRYFVHILATGLKSHRDFKIKRVVRETLYRRQCDGRC